MSSRWRKVLQELKPKSFKDWAIYTMGALAIIHVVISLIVD